MLYWYMQVMSLSKLRQLWYTAASNTANKNAWVYSHALRSAVCEGETHFKNKKHNNVAYKSYKIQCQPHLGGHILCFFYLFISIHIKMSADALVEMGDILYVHTCWLQHIALKSVRTAGLYKPFLLFIIAKTESQHNMGLKLPSASHNLQLTMLGRLPFTCCLINSVILSFCGLHSFACNSA